MGILLTLLKLLDAHGFLEATRDVMAEAHEVWDNLDDLSKRLYRKLRRCWIAVVAGCACMFLSLLLTAAKLTAAFLCEHSLWNVSELFSPTHGCIDLTHVIS